MTDAERKLLLNLLDNDSTEPSTAGRELGDQGSYRVMSAAFVAAALLEFSDRPPINELVAFVDRVRSGVSSAETLDAAKLEAALRGVLGEPEMLPDLTAQELAPIYVAVVRRVAADRLEDGPAREEFIASVEEAL